MENSHVIAFALCNSTQTTSSIAIIMLGNIRKIDLSTESVPISLFLPRMKKNMALI
jgi:hypothetical protein